MRNPAQAGAVFIDTVETSDARLAAPLFRKNFGHPVPPMPRHYVMFYRPPAAAQGSDSAQPLVVGYTHQLAFENVYLAGGMCVDRRRNGFPRWLFDEVEREGGLATIIMKESFATLGDCPAVFGTSATGVRAFRPSRGIRRHGQAASDGPLAPAAAARAQDALIDRVERIGRF